MRIAVIGTGYVGLVAGAGFADFGNEVSCVDIDEAKIERLRRGEVPIYEPGLDALVATNVKRGNLRFGSSIADAVRGAEVVFVAVGTPSLPSGAADLSAVFDAAIAIGPALTGYTVVVLKSTVPVGTAREVRARVARHTTQEFAVCSNPEFLKQGDAINDFMKPNRVVIGTRDERAREILRRLYAPLVRTNDRLLFMDETSAELTKYASNALLAVRISFVNELANLAERVGADIEDVRRGIGSDPRIGPKFLFPGVGYGGSCFPKDVKALLHTALANEVALEVVGAAERANLRQKLILPRKIEQHFGSLYGRTIAIWGLAFKPGTDDMREAPSLTLIERLLAAGAQVVAFDPAAMQHARRSFDARVTLAPGMYQACEGADALACVTEWHEFRRPDFARLRSLMRGTAAFDGRNIWDPAELRRLGFHYYGIGRS